MSSVRSRTTGPVAGLAVLAVGTALVAGCAQPGQLGQEGQAGGDGGPAPAAAPTAPGGPEAGAAPGSGEGAGVAGIPPPLAQAGSDARGAVEQPVEITTPGPSELLVRTEVLAPGQATGWQRHPGTVISAVRSGTVTVVRAGDCRPAAFGAGAGFFLGDGEPNELRNDGAEPVVLTRSELLAPGAPEREPVAPAC